MSDLPESLVNQARALWGTPTPPEAEDPSCHAYRLIDLEITEGFARILRERSGELGVATAQQVSGRMHIRGPEWELNPSWLPPKTRTQGDR